LIEQKGHRFLFEAFAGLTQEGLDGALYLVGTGPHKAMLKGLVREYGLGDRVRFLGWREDALAVIAAADVVVHPSLEDALPSAVIEALALEKPLVVSDVSGVRDMVGENEHGLIVPGGDAAAFRAALAATIADLDAARARARKGREFVLGYMDAARVAREYEACYRKVARAR
jgi:glycosyltransferase involved in cell wall biosynthesis